MSSFILPANHIATLVDAAILHRMCAFGHFDRETDLHRTYNVNHATRDALCTMLAEENHKSVVFTYADRASAAVTTFPRHPSKALFLSPTALLKAIASYEYQSSDHPGWHESKAAAFCNALRKTLIRALAGYEAADSWVIE